MLISSYRYGVCHYVAEAAQAPEKSDAYFYVDVFELVTCASDKQFCSELNYRCLCMKEAAASVAALTDEGGRRGRRTPMFPSTAVVSRMRHRYVVCMALYHGGQGRLPEGRPERAGRRAGPRPAPPRCPRARHRHPSPFTKCRVCTIANRNPPSQPSSPSQSRSRSPSPSPSPSPR